MGIFGARLPVSRDEFDWLLACFAWLRLVLDDEEKQIGLLLPDNRRLLEAKTAGLLFDVVRDHCEMADWPVDL